MKLLERQQYVLSPIEKLRNETDVEHQRLSCRATALKETLSGMENLNNTHSHVQSEAFRWLGVLSTQLLDLEAKKDFLLPLSGSTATIFESFSAINDVINLLKSMIETAFAQLPSFFAIVAREFYSTEMLCAQTANTILPSRTWSVLLSEASQSSGTGLFTRFAVYLRYSSRFSSAVQPKKHSDGSEIWCLEISK